MTAFHYRNQLVKCNKTGYFLSIIHIIAGYMSSLEFGQPTKSSQGATKPGAHQMQKLYSFFFFSPPPAGLVCIHTSLFAQV